jgi:hypothetical protein
MSQMQFWSMRHVPPDAPGGFVAAAPGARVDHVFAGDRRYVVILSRVESEARLEVRTDKPMHALMVDGETGLSLRVPSAIDIGSQRQSLSLSQHALLVLGFWADSRVMPDFCRSEGPKVGSEIQRFEVRRHRR